MEAVEVAKKSALIETLGSTIGHHLLNKYSTLGGKTGKLDEAVNRELNVTRS